MPPRKSHCHAVRLPHDLVDDNVRVTADVKSLDPKLSGNVHAIDRGLIFDHIVCHAEVQTNHVEELISLRGDQHNASPAPLRVKEPRCTCSSAHTYLRWATVVSLSIPPQSPPEPGS
jgi:hypothetical protein